MKKYLLICLLFISLLACKKSETVAPNSANEVSFIFSPNNVSSAITFKNFQTGEIKTFTNQTAVLSYNYAVKAGDRYSMEMKGNTTGLNDGYKIRIETKTKVLASDRALGDASVSERSLKIDHTFTDSDFK